MMAAKIEFMDWLVFRPSCFLMILLRTPIVLSHDHSDVRYGKKLLFLLGIIIT